MSAQEDPGVHRRRVATVLVGARKAQGLSQQDVADEMGWSLAKQVRIEAGRVSVSKTGLRALIYFYGIGDREAELLGAARAGRGRAWWQDFGVAPLYGRYLDCEQDACTLSSYHPVMIDWLLQTADYTALVSNCIPRERPGSEQIRGLVRRRQELLQPGCGRQATFVVDEAALRRVIGGRKVMVAQLDHLTGLMDQPHISLHVAPLDSQGFYLEHPVVLQELPDGEAVAFLEGVAKDKLVSPPDSMFALCHRLFRDLLESSLSGVAARALIEQVRADHLRQRAPT